MEKRPEKNRTDSIIKVAITGTESTGKSLLAKQLAGYFHTVFVPEYAREYIENLGRTYNFSDILNIAKGQLERETALYPKINKIIFCDTEFIVTKIWSEHSFRKCDEWILNTIENHVYDLYLLMNIDLPWEYDPQREHPNKREYLFNLYKQELSGRGFPFEIISGNGETRLQNAVDIIKKYFVV